MLSLNDTIFVHLFLVFRCIEELRSSIDSSSCGQKECRNLNVWVAIWDFPKSRGALLWGPYNKDPTISGTILGSPIFGNPHLELVIVVGTSLACTISAASGLLWLVLRRFSGFRTHASLLSEA